MIRYILYVKGEVDLSAISTYVTFFNSTISESLLEDIKQYQENPIIKKESEDCLFIPSNLQRNMAYLLLSDMPYLIKRSERENKLLSLNEVKLISSCQ